MPTLEDIEREVANSYFIRVAMTKAVSQLKVAEKNVGPDVLKMMLLGKRKLDPKEYEETRKKFGSQGLMAIEAMEHLNKAQKQYLFKQMGYPIEEVE